jgi:hypothetical protein
MRPGRETDTRVAKELFGNEVWATNRVVYERTSDGKRPLRRYSSDIQFAWEIAMRFKISLLPVEGNRWFAFTAPAGGWNSPKEFTDFLIAGDFNRCGASESDNPAFAICMAALIANEKRLQNEKSENLPPPTEISQHH